MKNAQNPNKYFDSTLSNAVTELIEKWAGERVFEDEEYQEYMGSAERLQAKIKALLGENGKLVDELAEKLTWALCCYTEPNYLQGFRDCFLFFRKLELL